MLALKNNQKQFNDITPHDIEYKLEVEKINPAFMQGMTPFQEVISFKYQEEELLLVKLCFWW